jgi:ABC-type uncharacterized transport system substrate-binding protein
MQVGDRGKPALVFCGVNNPIETYNYPRPNITGVKETPHILDTIEFYRRLQPKAERFLFLSDNSPTSEGVVHYIKSNKRIGDFLVGVELPSSFEEWKSIVSNQGKQIDAILVYVYHTLSESTGSDNKVAPNDVLSWTIENSSVPVIALLSFAIDAGALGGVVESGVEQGYEAGLMAKKILEGTAPKDIPVKDVLKGKAMVNVKSAAHFGIRIPESEIEGKDIVLTGM